MAADPSYNPKVSVFDELRMALKFALFKGALCSFQGRNFKKKRKISSSFD